MNIELFGCDSVEEEIKLIYDFRWVGLGCVYLFEKYYKCMKGF
jgi:hypothetical protein